MPIPALLGAIEAASATAGATVEVAGATSEAGSFAAALRAGQAAIREVNFEEQDVKIEIPVSSAAISMIAYEGNAQAGTITVTFHRGGQLTYDYPGALAEFTAFALASSKGQFFNEHLKDRR